MEKNTILRIIIGIMSVLVLTVGMLALLGMLSKSMNNEQGDSGALGKTLVVYFSAEGHTRKVARKITKQLGADEFEVKPVHEYTDKDLTWTKSDSRVARERANKSLREVELVESEVRDWDKYDTVLLGYPIWWDEAAWPMSTFVKMQDFSGKTVIPFCTSSSSGIENSALLLQRASEGGKWQAGHRFASEATDDEITEWVRSIK